MKTPRSVFKAAIVPTTVMLAAGICAAAARFPVPQRDALRAALTFHAPFDGGVDAAHAAGDGRMYWAPSFKERQQARPGLPESGEVQVARGAGRYGDALRFTKKGSPLVFFQGARNMPYAASNWSGTVSLWLSVDPVHDLEPGFCDPIQITPRAWNDAAFFVEFEKRPESIPFRLGVYADFSVWNPEKRRFADIPAGERPLVTVDDPPFGRGRWTHVVFTFERFNTGRPDGVARLYLDGKPYGELSPRQQTFTWDPDGNTIALGLSYVGLLDELAIFNRALTADEILTLHTLQNGVALLTSPGDFVPRTVEQRLPFLRTLAALAYRDRSTERHLAAGRSPEQARRAARAEMGSLEAIKEGVRDVGWERLVMATAHDIRYGARMLAKSPGFACAAVTTLDVVRSVSSRCALVLRRGNPLRRCGAAGVVRPGVPSDANRSRCHAPPGVVAARTFCRHRCDVEESVSAEARVEPAHSASMSARVSQSKPCQRTHVAWPHESRTSSACQQERCVTNLTNSPPGRMLL